MPTYITLVDYTEDGITNMKESPDRLDRAKGVVEEMGGEFTHFFLTMGSHDAVAIMEMPDDTKAAQAALTIASGGAVRTETLKAFTEDEYRDVIAGLP
ncbi:MAG: GYD domain-containing protein [Halobacteriota archaeon]